MVEFSPDLGTRRALESGPYLQLGARSKDAAPGRLLRWILKPAEMGH
jgi:hypothetical protein